jgi:phosphorylase kinase alpha/beta subunit
LLTACLEERWELAHSFQQRLQGLAVSDGQDLLQPELYLLPEEAIAAERRYPGSQQRQANENVPLLWTQSLWLLGQLLLEGLIQPADLDPCGRRQRRSLGCRQVRVVLVPGDAAVAEALAQEGLPMATPGDGGVGVEASTRLVEALASLGAWPALGLGGPAPAGVGTMAVTRLYRCGPLQLPSWHRCRRRERSIWPMIPSSWPMRCWCL